MQDELHISKEMIRQILHEDLRKSHMCVEFVPHRLRDKETQWRLISHHGFIQTCQENHSFFSLSQGENCPQRRKFQDVEDIKRIVMAEISDLHLTETGSRVWRWLVVSVLPNTSL
jgi:hypothetical protein